MAVRWIQKKRDETSPRSGLEPWVLRHLALVLAIGALAAAAAFAISYRAIEGSDRDRFDVAIKAATAVAAVAAGLLTWARLDLSRREHQLAADRDLTERYSRSIDQIGHTDSLVKVGGIFALESFALDATRMTTNRDVDWRMALDVLSALARNLSVEQAHASSQIPDGVPSIHPAPVAVVEAVRALGRFNQRSGRTETLRHDLNGIIVRSADLRGADLRSANLRGANLADADLTDTHLAGADLEAVSLGRASLERANLAGTNLTRARLVGARLRDADLTRARLVGADVADANLLRARLNYASLVEADLRRADLLYAELRAAKFDNAELADANLERTDLSGASFVGANLMGASLVGANLAGVDFSDANLRYADLGDANLIDANFDTANLEGANLAGAELSNAYFVGANLEGTYLWSITVTEAIFDSDEPYSSVKRS